MTTAAVPKHLIAESLSRARLQIDCDVGPGPGRIPFLSIIEPFVETGSALLAGRAPGMDRSISPEASEDLRRSLRLWLATLFTPILAHEFALFRLDRSGVPPDLAPANAPPGDTLYRSFCAHLLAGDLHALLGEYPALPRLAGRCMRDWVEGARELERRIRRDRRTMSRELAGGRNPGRVVSLRTLSTDRHGGGRTVLLLAFESGARIVYKPRPVGMELRFREVVEWLAGRPGSGPALRAPRVFDRGSYGWTELVEPAECPDETAAGRYHYRLGGLLALLHALGATDCHMENLIAAGDRPVLVDGETLLYPGGGESPAHGMDGSVLTTGLLPAVRLGESGDVSGVAGGREEAETEAVVWSAPGTDAMALVPGTAPAPARHNVPTLGGRLLRVEDYRDHVLAGFSDGYRDLCRHREDLLAGPITRLGTELVRFLPRATSTYWKLQLSALTPHALTSPARRRARLDRLSLALRNSPEPDHRQPLVEAERRALERLDIPAFYTRADSRDLPLPGGRRITGYFAESALERAVRRFKALSAEDLARQTEVVNAALDRLAAQPCRRLTEGR
ncbi:MAG TPA: type 2 lanthipeptide synthetase LanM [Gemmatimonadales bacterium]|nr:type 2 lanthipeptide synthetase LanM [Gemmatimonadales bacterium]